MIKPTYSFRVYLSLADAIDYCNENSTSITVINIVPSEYKKGEPTRWTVIYYYLMDRDD